MISIIVPARNEEQNIARTIEGIESCINFAHELIIVNDHSDDSTVDEVGKLMAEYSNLVLVDNKREPGFANALMTGFKESRHDIVVPIMGDLCDDLNTVKEMLDKINQGYDIVCGSRYIKGGVRLGGPKLKGFLSSLAGVSLRYLLAIPTSDIPNAFKMYRKRVLENIEINSKGFEVSMEIPLKAYYKGFKITEVPTVWRGRTKGKTHFKVFKSLPRYLKLYLWAVIKRITAKRVHG